MRGGWNFFFKINRRDSTFIREMRVLWVTKDLGLGVILGRILLRGLIQVTL